MALVSGIIALNTKNQFSTFKRMQVKDLKIKLPTKLQYEIGIDQSTSYSHRTPHAPEFISKTLKT